MPDLNRPAFKAMQEKLFNIGFMPESIVNPHDLISDPDVHWVTAMKKDIAALMQCDAIVMLHGWENSRGAKLEHFIATSLNMIVIREDECVKHYQQVG